MSLYDVTMPMFGIAVCNRALSSPDAASTCARFAQASLPRAGSTCLRLRVRSRYSPRAAADRPPIRSVTSATVSFSPCLSEEAIVLLVPAVAVSLGQSDRGRGPPGAGRIRLHQLARRAPAGLDAVDPVPRGLDLVAAHEQRGVALEHVEQQALVCDAGAATAFVLRQRQLERHLAQAHAFQARLFAQDLERHALFGLQLDQQPVGRQRRLVLDE